MKLSELLQNVGYLSLPDLLKQKILKVFELNIDLNNESQYEVYINECAMALKNQDPKDQKTLLDFLLQYKEIPQKDTEHVEAQIRAIMLGYRYYYVKPGWFSFGHLEALSAEIPYNEVVGLNSAQAQGMARGLTRDKVTTVKFGWGHALATIEKISYDSYRDLNDDQAYGLTLGLSREQVMAPWFKNGHVFAVKSGIPYEMLIGLSHCQATGMTRCKLTREQVMFPWFSNTHIEAIECNHYCYEEIAGLTGVHVQGSLLGLSNVQLSTPGLTGFHLELTKKYEFDQISKLSMIDAIAVVSSLTIEEVAKEHLDISESMLLLEFSVNLKDMRFPKEYGKRIGLTDEEVSPQWFSWQHAYAIQSGQKYRDVAGLRSAQALGISIGLKHDQVKPDWFDWGHAIALHGDDQLKYEDVRKLTNEQVAYGIILGGMTPDQVINRKISITHINATIIGFSMGHIIDLDEKQVNEEMRKSIEALKRHRNNPNMNNYRKQFYSESDLSHSVSDAAKETKISAEFKNKAEKPYGCQFFTEEDLSKASLKKPQEYIVAEGQKKDATWTYDDYIEKIVKPSLSVDAIENSISHSHVTSLNDFIKIARNTPLNGSSLYYHYESSYSSGMINSAIRNYLEWVSNNVFDILMVLAEKNAEQEFFNLIERFYQFSGGITFLERLKSQEPCFFEVCGRLLLFSSIRIGLRDFKVLSYLINERNISPNVVAGPAENSLLLELSDFPPAEEQLQTELLNLLIEKSFNLHYINRKGQDIFHFWPRKSELWLEMGMSPFQCDTQGRNILNQTLKDNTLSDSFFAMLLENGLGLIRKKHRIYQGTNLVALQRKYKSDNYKLGIREDKFLERLLNSEMVLLARRNSNSGVQFYEWILSVESLREVLQKILQATLNNQSPEIFFPNFSHICKNILRCESDFVDPKIIKLLTQDVDSCVVMNKVLTDLGLFPGEGLRSLMWEYVCMDISLREYRSPKLPDEMDHKEYNESSLINSSQQPAMVKPIVFVAPQATQQLSLDSLVIPKPAKLSDPTIIVPVHVASSIVCELASATSFEKPLERTKKLVLSKIPTTFSGPSLASTTKPTTARGLGTHKPVPKKTISKSEESKLLVFSESDKCIAARKKALERIKEKRGQEKKAPKTTEKKPGFR